MWRVTEAKGSSEEAVSHRKLKREKKGYI